MIKQSTVLINTALPNWNKSRRFLPVQVVVYLPLSRSPRNQWFLWSSWPEVCTVARDISQAWRHTVCTCSLCLHNPCKKPAIFNPFIPLCTFLYIKCTEMWIFERGGTIQVFGFVSARRGRGSIPHSDRHSDEDLTPTRQEIEGSLQSHIHKLDIRYSIYI